jgi:hypothetical protein
MPCTRLATVTLGPERDRTSWWGGAARRSRRRWGRPTGKGSAPWPIGATGCAAPGTKGATDQAGIQALTAQDRALLPVGCRLIGSQDLLLVLRGEHPPACPRGHLGSACRSSPATGPGSVKVRAARCQPAWWRSGCRGRCLDKCRRSGLRRRSHARWRRSGNSRRRGSRCRGRALRRARRRRRRR